MASFFIRSIQSLILYFDEYSLNCPVNRVALNYESQILSGHFMSECPCKSHNDPNSSWFGLSFQVNMQFIKYVETLTAATLLLSMN